MMISEAHFNRATLECMTALRRRLKQEMGVDVRLAEPDAAENMIRLSRDSALEEVRELGARLAEILAPPPAVEAQAPAPGVIASRRNPTQDTSPPPEGLHSDTSTRVRIYRGQVVR